MKLEREINKFTQYNLANLYVFDRHLLQNTLRSKQKFNLSISKKINGYALAEVLYDQTAKEPHTVSSMSYNSK